MSNPFTKYIRVRTSDQMPRSLVPYFEPEDGQTLYESLDLPREQLERELFGQSRTGTHKWIQRFTIGRWANECYSSPDGCLVSHGTTRAQLLEIAKSGLIPKSSTETYGSGYTGKNVYGVPRTTPYFLSKSGLAAGDDSTGSEWYWALMGLRQQRGDNPYDAPSASELSELAVVRFRLGDKSDEVNADFEPDPHFTGDSVRFKKKIPANKLSFYVLADPKAYAKQIAARMRRKLVNTWEGGRTESKAKVNAMILFYALLDVRAEEQEMTRKQVLED